MPLAGFASPECRGTFRRRYRRIHVAAKALNEFPIETQSRPSSSSSSFSALYHRDVQYAQERIHLFCSHLSRRHRLPVVSTAFSCSSCVSAEGSKKLNPPQWRTDPDASYEEPLSQQIVSDFVGCRTPPSWHPVSASPPPKLDLQPHFFFVRYSVLFSLWFDALRSTAPSIGQRTRCRELQSTSPAFLRETALNVPQRHKHGGEVPQLICGQSCQ